ncbi:helix-turn-helix domain-containing protein [Micromonospora carbonacea]|uniref:Helix-turn-helix domain-containing protein n=1 Tax=Micromonospora carbonacea TaxID=47853 RepID=A0A1C4X0S0_9ACTN|nr:helix-turn-helix domain-containing protein [Micromonospora carbonacea]SCF01994.1 Helix-turn-helix domain-containing protein [Micromonospora carbonacea]
MSLVVKAAMRDTRDLRGTDRLVVLAIAAHTNSAGDAWPAVGTIAEYVGVSERTVQRALARLVQAGRLAVRQVAGIATRVYRILSETVAAAVERVTSAARGVTPQRAGVTEPAAGGDTPGASPEVEDPQKLKGRAAARNWRRFIPKSKAAADPERRGVPSPPPQGTVRWCPKHQGSPAHNCGPCRSEALGGAR